MAWKFRKSAFTTSTSLHHEPKINHQIYHSRNHQIRFSLRTKLQCLTETQLFKPRVINNLLTAHANFHCCCASAKIDRGKKLTRQKHKKNRKKCMTTPYGMAVVFTHEVLMFAWRRFVVSGRVKKAFFLNKHKSKKDATGAFWAKLARAGRGGEKKLTAPDGAKYRPIMR